MLGKQPESLWSYCWDPISTLIPRYRVLNIYLTDKSELSCWQFEFCIIMVDIAWWYPVNIQIFYQGTDVLIGGYWHTYLYSFMTNRPCCFKTLNAVLEVYSSMANPWLIPQKLTFHGLSSAEHYPKELSLFSWRNLEYDKGFFFISMFWH